jgi:hypothetical protein
MSDPAFDLVIGDVRGQSTGAGICERYLQPFFSDRGLRAGYAGPRGTDRQGRPLVPAAILYSGGFITSRYGQPAAGQYAFQIEVNRETCRRDLGEMEQIFREFFSYLLSQGKKVFDHHH